MNIAVKNKYKEKTLRQLGKTIGSGLDGRGSIPILAHGFLFTMLL